MVGRERGSQQLAPIYYPIMYDKTRDEGRADEPFSLMYQRFEDAQNSVTRPLVSFGSATLP